MSSLGVETMKAAESSHSQTFSSVISSTVPLLLGTLLDFLLCGTLLVQTYAYYILFPKDPFIFKILGYKKHHSTSCFGLPLRSATHCIPFNDDSRNYIPILTVVIATLVQACFCVRITVIRKAAWPISLLIAVISLAQLVAGVTSGTLAFIEDNQPDSSLPGTTSPNLRQHIRVILIPIWIVGGATADILIAVTMTVLLSTATVNESTQSLANKIIRLVLETNSCTAAAANIGVVLYFALPPTNLYLYVPTLALIGLYANTLLVTLNNRAIILRAREQQLVKSGQRSIAISDTAPLRRGVVPAEIEDAV
ncbi:hypothetical protein R3P38DRAFT_3620124 [Favolaschia claudopus]|uniref:DUF6534 domain-containing protein n=1 Tax=Favolaschia claudopus TaxID=2862362 RepID=A0AAW0DBZ2_9AGAR